MLRERVDALAQSSPNFQRRRRLPKDNSNAKSCLRGSRDSESFRERRSFSGCRSRPRNGTNTIPKSRRREPRLKQARMPRGRRLSSFCSLTQSERSQNEPQSRFGKRLGGPRSRKEPEKQPAPKISKKKNSINKARRSAMPPAIFFGPTAS